MSRVRKGPSLTASPLHVTPIEVSQSASEPESSRDQAVHTPASTQPQGSHALVGVPPLLLACLGRSLLLCTLSSWLYV